MRDAELLGRPVLGPTALFDVLTKRCHQVCAHLEHFRLSLIESQVAKHTAIGRLDFEARRLSTETGDRLTRARNCLRKVAFPIRRARGSVGAKGLRESLRRVLFRLSVVSESQMIGARETLDVEAAVLDPAAYFESPMDVVKDPRLANNDRQRILESWVRDAELLSQAEAENMQGTERPRLQEAKLALRELEQKQLE